MRIFEIKTKIRDKGTVDTFGFKTYRKVIVATTGANNYLGEELGMKSTPNAIIEVHRDLAELAKLRDSILGKPIVNLHPTRDMEMNNLPTEVIGVALNPVIEDDNLIVDLMFYKSRANDEVSLGYDAEILKVNDKWIQRDVEVNHIAIVPKGRCGKLCKIQDKRIDDMPKIKIGDSSVEVTQEVQTEFDRLNGEVEVLHVAVTDAEVNAIRDITQRNIVLAKAKNMGVEALATDTTLAIKTKICDKLGIKTDGKTEAFIDGALSVDHTPYTPPNVHQDRSEALEALNKSVLEF